VSFFAGELYPGPSAQAGEIHAQIGRFRCQFTKGHCKGSAILLPTVGPMLVVGRYAVEGIFGPEHTFQFPGVGH
jgi:hypothetical protein